MRKSTAILLIVVLILQMCTGFLVNSNESDRADMKACDDEDKQEEYDRRASREEVQDNHTDARGPERSAAPVATLGEGAHFVTLNQIQLPPQQVCLWVQQCRRYCVACRVTPRQG